MCMRCHHKSNSLCYYFILAAFIFSVFISIANFAKLKGSLNIRVLQYVINLRYRLHYTKYTCKGLHHTPQNHSTVTITKICLLVSDEAMF